MKNYVCIRKQNYKEKEYLPGDIILADRPPQGFMPFDPLGLQGEPVLIKNTGDDTCFRFLYKIKGSNQRFLIHGNSSGEEAILAGLPADKDGEKRPKNGTGLGGFSGNSAYAFVKWSKCTPEPAKEPPAFDPLRYDNGFGDQLRNGINLENYYRR